jgi:hypothetical protein
MDFMPAPNNDQRATWEVPYIGNVRYDSQGFHGFLERNGWNEQRLLESFTQQKFHRFGQSVMQEWLYFGVLHEFADICQVPINLNEFVGIGSDGRRIVTGKSLPEYMARVENEVGIPR